MVPGNNVHLSHRMRLTKTYSLLFGPLAAAIFGFGIVALAGLIPGYSQVQQTVSEIGEIGSPERVPFAIMLGCVAACIVVFAAGFLELSAVAGHSRWAAYLTGFMALPAAALGIFAYPHPLHNIFGLSELIGYQAPLVMAFTWRRDPQAKTLVTFSWIMSVLIWSAILVNLGSLDSGGMIWAYIKPVHGLAQRLLFFGWFGWCAVVGILLFQYAGSIARGEKASSAQVGEP